MAYPFRFGLNQGFLSYCLLSTLYPDFPLWRTFDPNGQFSTVYNRYSRVLFNADRDEANRFELNNADSFTITVDPCGPQLVDLKVKYHVFNSPEPYACLKEVRRVEYPAATFYVYERSAGE